MQPEAEQFGSFWTFMGHFWGKWSVARHFSFRGQGMYPLPLNAHQQRYIQPCKCLSSSRYFVILFSFISKHAILIQKNYVSSDWDFFFCLEFSTSTTYNWTFDYDCFQLTNFEFEIINLETILVMIKILKACGTLWSSESGSSRKHTWSNRKLTGDQQLLQALFVCYFIFRIEISQWK